MQNLPPEPWRWDATDMARAIRLRAISAREATQSVLARCAEVNPLINAVVEVLADEALAAAEAADASMARGEALGPLHGVPVSTKINVDQKGVATSNGCVPLSTLVAQEDSAVVGNLRRAGAILFGRTNTPALSMRWFTENDLHGRTLNPWSAGHTPGGSSGGAAAALAAGIGPIAHGNDLGGSVRYPAYACGVAGIRPSFGRVPAYNPTAVAERPFAAQLMSAQGPLARSVRDLRLALSVMAEGDARDPWWMPAPLTGAPPPRPIRVALCPDPMGSGVHPAVRNAVERAGAILASAGYAVEMVAPPDFTGTVQDWEAFSRTEGRIALADGFAKLGDEGARQTFTAMMARAPELSLAAWAATAARRTARQRDWAAFLAHHPIIVLPVSLEPPFPQGLDLEGSQAFDSVFRAQAPMLVAPLLGLPGVSVPTGLAEGLPMGVQIMAARWREDLALDAAEVIEAACPAATPITPRGSMPA